MGVGRIFSSGGALGDFSKIFLGGPKSGKICFFPLETKKTTFFAKSSKIPGGQCPPFRRPCSYRKRERTNRPTSWQTVNWLVRLHMQLRLDFVIATACSLPAKYNVTRRFCMKLMTKHQGELSLRWTGKRSFWKQNFCCNETRWVRSKLFLYKCLQCATTHVSVRMFFCTMTILQNKKMPKTSNISAERIRMATNPRFGGWSKLCFKCSVTECKSEKGHNGVCFDGCFFYSVIFWSKTEY